MAELLIELLIEGLAEPLVTLLARALGATLPSRWQERRWLAALGYVLWGLLAGALSLWAWPTHLLRAPALRALSFLLSPLLCALALFVVGNVRSRHGHSRRAIDGAWYGLLLGLSYQLVRALGAS